ncbi:MAG: glutamine--fructose-6-phosphate transaminase (isomerizing) [Candidatus Nealsonbacteria bacterium]|nr:glutamine--fructose-6-phosphate transaminase (isomerizing) [Candidatus Nealsonbacteria bacterium]
MCGIIGYIGKGDKYSVLFDSLKRVAYRGYDSSGAVVLKEDGPLLVRSVGKLEELIKKVGETNLEGSVVIGHSRWATHGGVTEENAHPHSCCKDNIFVVHNGIIENYKELKDQLLKDGHVFKSETDTEVIPHLIEHFFQGNLEDAVCKAAKLLKGTYGLAVIAKDDPDKIVAVRMFSPLVISVNDSGGFIASDPAAIISHSERMVFLEDGEVAVIKGNDFFITDLDSNRKDAKETELDWDLEEAQKGGYPYFMIKEIMDQPESIANSMRGRILLDEGTAKLGGLDLVREKLRGIKRINIIACGTSYYAGLVGEYLIEELAGVSAKVDLASEFRYRNQVIKDDEAYLFISQSGETADTLAALREVKRKGALTLGIVNVVGSTIARETDAGIYNHAGPEIGVASTKAFSSQIVVLTLLALYLGRERSLSLQEGKEIAQGLIAMPSLVEEFLKDDSTIQEIAKKYKDSHNFLFLGRKYGCPVALEGALKLKEISYIHAEGYASGEMKHGPLALVDENFPTMAICLSDSVYNKVVSNVEEVKARRGSVIIIATEGNEEIKKMSEDVIYIPKTLEVLSPIMAIIPLQLLAYHIGVLKGYDVDCPRNLAKVCTVE